MKQSLVFHLPEMLAGYWCLEEAVILVVQGAAHMARA
jgi:hypothetical protein